MTEFGVEESRPMVFLVSIKWQACQLRLFGSHSTPTGWSRQEGVGNSSLWLVSPWPEK